MVGATDRDSGTDQAAGVRLVGIMLLGALIFLALFVAASATRPTLTLDLRGDSRATLRAFYPPEYLGNLSWLWTRPRAELSLPTLDRDVGWHWSGRVLLNRPPDLSPTVLRIAIDDVVAFEDTVVHDSLVEFTVPQSLGLTGAVITFDTTPTFVPGGDDTRELGVALASVSLIGERGGAPKTGILFYSLLAMGALGVAFVTQRLRPEGILAGLALAIIGHAWLLMRDVTVHGAYPSWAVALAAGVWLGIVVFARVVDRLPTVLSERLPDTATRQRNRVVLASTQIYARVLGAIPDTQRPLLGRILTGAAYVLPVVLIINAVGFWGRGVIDEEAMYFVLNYLADRPLVATIFDPLLNDWGAYQARELSYVFDLIDARVFASLLDRGVLLFIPLSGVLGLLAVWAVHAWGSRRVLRLDGATASLLFALFVSSIVTQASTAILYRSSKIVLGVALLAFLFHLTALVRATGESRRGSLGQMAALFLLGIVMSITDRQGFFYLACATALVTGLWVTTRLRGVTERTNHAWIIATSVGALAVASLYNRIIAPAVIRWANSYSPGFEYQQLELAGLFDVTLVSQAWTMFQAQASFFFGGVPFALVGGVAAIGWVASLWRSRLNCRDREITVTTLLTDVRLQVTVGALGALVVLLAVMILRHPPVYNIPDHAFWYYTLTLHVVFLFGLSLAIASLGISSHLPRRVVMHLLLIVMIVGNVTQYADQRRTMIESARWFQTQHERSRRLVDGYEATADMDARAGNAVGRGPYPADVAQDEERFLGLVQTAYAELGGR